jgi:hypothetical protein
MLNVSVARSMLTSNDDSHAGMYAHASTSTLTRIAWINILLMSEAQVMLRSPIEVHLTLEILH